MVNFSVTSSSPLQKNKWLIFPNMVPFEHFGKDVTMFDIKVKKDLTN